MEDISELRVESLYLLALLFSWDGFDDAVPGAPLRQSVDAIALALVLDADGSVKVLVLSLRPEVLIREKLLPMTGGCPSAAILFIVKDIAGNRGEQSSRGVSGGRRCRMSKDGCQIQNFLRYSLMLDVHLASGSLQGREGYLASRRKID